MSSNVYTMIARGAVWQGLLLSCTFGWELGIVPLETSDVRARPDGDTRRRTLGRAVAAFPPTFYTAEMSRVGARGARPWATTLLRSCLHASRRGEGPVR